MAANKTKPICHIHDKVRGWEDVDDIRENVCVNDELPTKHADGNHYCLFHLPTKDKDIVKFEEIFQARLDAVKKKVAESEKLREEEKEEAKREISYDFRYVWFPSKINLKNFNFQAYAKFEFATFSTYINFSSTTFSSTANFGDVTFLEAATFESAIFSDTAYFTNVIFFDAAVFALANFSASSHFDRTVFNEQANFMGTSFNSVYFNSATFSYAFFRTSTFIAQAEFKLASFVLIADFGWVNFLETSQVFFQEPRFHGEADFSYSVFAGYVAFEGTKGESVFLGEEIERQKLKDLEQTLAEKEIDFQIPDIFRRNREATLNLQNARLEKPERISFHRVRLCPSWFVNVDSREMVFTDVRWDNLDRQFRNPNIIAEIESLENRGVSEPSRLLEIACRQLAVNAEENNRYEDASTFRYMTMETKRLEYRWHGRLWTLSWWYRLSSGYGENWSRALCVLLGILVLSGVFYNSPFANFELAEIKQENIQNLDFSIQQTETPAGEKLKFQKMDNLEGFVHSLYVAALQRPEPKAADTLTRLFVILETIFAPLQAALLALAIRRKFMR